MAAGGSESAAMEPDQIQKTALRLFHAGDFAGSNAQMLQLCQGTAGNSFRRFCIGRNYRCLGDLAAARHWLTLALRSAAPYVWVAFELALLEQQCAAPEAAGEMLRRFLAGAAEPPPALSNIQKAQAMEICHRVFRADRLAGARLYRLAEAQGVGDGLALARLVEELLDSGDVAAAAARLDDLAAQPRHAPAAQLARARVLQALDRRAEALEAMARWRSGLAWTVEAPAAGFACAPALVG